MGRKHSGVEVHGSSLRNWFMWRGKRCRESLGLEPTKANIKHAAQQRAAIQHAIKTGSFEYGAYFPESRHAKATDRLRDARLSEVAERYIQLKSTDLTPETQRRYQNALDMVCDALGKNLVVSTLVPEDVQLMRGEFAATRQVSTANHYLAVAAGLFSWLKANRYTEHDLSAVCSRLSAEDVAPDPFTHEEFQALVKTGCLHPQEVAAITLAVYSGARPGELCGLAREDADLEPEDTTVWLNHHQSRVDLVTPLITPTAQARQPRINRWFNPDSWHTKLTKLMKRAGVRHRRPYQTRHTYACWSLTAHGNLAFIAKQMGHKDYSTLVKVYARWIDTESADEAARIWSEMQKRGAFAPLVPHRNQE